MATTKTYPVGTMARYDGNNVEAGECLAALPKGAVRLLDAMRARGWRWAVGWREDSGGNPFLQIRAGLVPGVEVQGTWHTRATGTPRLFSMMTRSGHGLSGNWRDATLTGAIAYVEADRT